MWVVDIIDDLIYANTTSPHLGYIAQVQAYLSD